ncbi:MAG: Gfo/Idh/MocA family oxidoreductase [Clostridiales bacterium]|nr:Gfo/Idh/MocA family oxidoreductase [Clostridiales bacterium]
MKKVKLGIIGIGNMGSGHAGNIKGGKCPDFDIVAIADINEERLNWAKEQKYNEGITYFNDAIEMLDSGLIDACLITVPHYDHPRFAIECMKRSIHVMLEKPAGVYTKQVLEMNTEAKKHPEVIFGMMFNQRTNCVYRKLKELVDSGEYGEIRRTNWIITNWYRPQAYYNSGGWRATWAGEGGGVLLNQCPHQLDLWQWICGMPKKVRAHLHYGKWHDIEVEDDVTAYVEYENGATGVFITSTGDACGTNRLEIQMDRAKFVVENDVLSMDEYDISEKVFTKENQKPFGSPAITHKMPETDGENQQHIGILNAWADAILRGGNLVAHGEEGINGLILSNAMHLSSFLDKEIELPFDDELYYNELMKRVASSRKKENVSSVFADTTSVMDSTKS